MVNKKYFLVLSLVLACLFISLNISAATIYSVSVNSSSSPDNFFSASRWNGIINVYANVSGINLVTPGHSLTANFSNLGNIDCGIGVGPVIDLINSTYSGDIYNGSCNVSVEAATSDFVAGPVIVVAIPAGAPAIDTSAIAILYNMTTPPNFGDPCMQWGSMTTDFQNVIDFAHVNLQINPQINFTCMTGGLLNGTIPHAFNNAAFINLTSVNISTFEQAQKLAGLATAIQINISNPKSFDPSRIYINSTYFDSLNTSASITLYNLPFTSVPNVLADPGAAGLNGSAQISWYPNGYSTAAGVNIGNLTFSVLGFSGYNVTDNVAPIISINTPVNNLNVSLGTIVFSVIVNGTGTEPSYISVADNIGSTYVYNSSSGLNTAGCVNITSNLETWNCTLSYTVGSLSEGEHTITVSVWDYGLIAPGNTNSSSRIFNVDRTGPAITINSPNTYVKTNSINFNLTALDGIVASELCWMTLDNGVTNQTMTKTGNNFNYTNSSIIAGNYLAKYYCNDTLGNINGTTTLNFTVDLTNPALSTLSSSVSSSGATISYTSNESVNVTINYGTSLSLGSFSNSATYATSADVSLSSLSASTVYYYNLTICDQAGNCITNGTNSFTTSAAAQTPSGGSTTGATTSVPQITDLSNGYVKSMTVNDELKFTVQSQQHSVFVQSLIGDKLVLKIKSDPQIATFYPGEEKKFEITNDSYYDLYIKFNNIRNGYANLTLRTIHELMPGKVANLTASNATIGSNITSPIVPTPTAAPVATSKKSLIFIVFVIIVIIVGVIVYLRKVKRYRYYYHY